MRNEREKETKQIEMSKEPPKYPVIQIGESTSDPRRSRIYDTPVYTKINKIEDAERTRVAQGNASDHPIDKNPYNQSK